VFESKTVVIAVLFSVIKEPETKPTPTAVSVNVGLPAATAEGEMDVNANVLAALPVTANVTASEVVPSGFIARMFTLAGDAICSAFTFAVSCVADDTVVGSASPPQSRIVPLTKFVPVAVRVKSLPPAVTVVGLIDASVGGNTPWNPPQPHRTRQRIICNRKIGL